MLHQPLKRPFRVEHPLLLVAVWKRPFQELLQVVKRLLKPQFPAPSKQLLVLKPEVPVSRSLPLGDNDRWPVESPHHQSG